MFNCADVSPINGYFIKEGGFIFACSKFHVKMSVNWREVEILRLHSNCLKILRTFLSKSLKTKIAELVSNSIKNFDRIYCR